MTCRNGRYIVGIYIVLRMDKPALSRERNKRVKNLSIYVALRTRGDGQTEDVIPLTIKNLEVYRD